MTACERAPLAEPASPGAQRVEPPSPTDRAAQHGRRPDAWGQEEEAPRKSAPRKPSPGEEAPDSRRATRRTGALRAAVGRVALAPRRPSTR
eukprot:11043453-Alexandrium_andersonii.AAC.1